MYHSSELAKKHEDAVFKAAQNPEAYREFLSYVFGEHQIVKEINTVDGVTFIDLYYKEKPQIENAVMKVAVRRDYGAGPIT